MTFYQLKRIFFDSLILTGIGVVVYFMPYSILPSEAKDGLLALFITKLLFVSAGIVHAHVSRKLLFPYINFEKERRWDNNLLVIVFYVIIIWSWARGG